MSDSAVSVGVEVAQEVIRAMGLHKGMNSPHEAYAVILEELDEFKAEVFRKVRDPQAMRGELVQTAAMCVRAILDLALCSTTSARGMCGV